jgi:formate hydrogenlyase subunit 3/multisubunit Na+/H+ antiporter MnhD subunit
MFFRILFNITTNLQQTVLIANTILLIVILIAVELIYSERSKEDRRELRYFFPLILVFVVILLFAVYKQTWGI